jgi:tight adherence protein B
MNEILIFALLNVVVALIAFVLDYVLFARERSIVSERYDGLIDRGDREVEKRAVIYLPDWLFIRLMALYRRIPRAATQQEGKRTVLQEVTPGKVIIANLCIILLSFNLQTIFGIPLYASLLVFISLELFEYTMLKNQQIREREAIEKRLPEILDVIARVYRVHNDLRIAMREVSVHVADPTVREVFGQVVSLSRFGYTVEEALDFVSRRIESQDFDFVVSSIKLNVPVGGNLPYLLENTARMIRQRKEATDEIQNLMFQSKASSIMSALLVPVIVFISFLSSDRYQEALLRNPSGRLVFLGCVIWWLLGVLIIRKNSRIKL